MALSIRTYALESLSSAVQHKLDNTIIPLLRVYEMDLRVGKGESLPTFLPLFMCVAYSMPLGSPQLLGNKCAIDVVLD